MKIHNIFLYIVDDMNHLVKILPRQNCIQEEIQIILNQGMPANIWNNKLCLEFVIKKFKV